MGDLGDGKLDTEQVAKGQWSVATESRRSIVAKGARLAYGAPLIAASFLISDTTKGHGDDHEDVCDCVESYRSPKPGKLVGGDKSKCYVCKGVADDTTVCGDKTKGSIQVVEGWHGPVCACKSEHCYVNGQKIKRNAKINCPPQIVDCEDIPISKP